jgi:hypothetical protein
MFFQQDVWPASPTLHYLDDPINEVSVDLMEYPVSPSQDQSGQIGNFMQLNACDTANYFTRGQTAHISVPGLPRKFAFLQFDKQQ